MVVEETVRASSASMVQRFADLNLLAVSLLMSSDHLVLVALCLDVAKLFRHFFKLEFADRACQVIAMVADEV